MSRLREKYVDSGDVQFVYKHFAILGAESARSAEASECAAEQDAFWPYHDLVFADQQENRSALSDETLISFAGDLELDIEAFTECLDSSRNEEIIQRDTQIVQALGVRGTPGFLINGVFISGAQPIEVFEEIIDEQLASVGSD